jgi:hypothetical protein
MTIYDPIANALGLDAIERTIDNYEQCTILNPTLNRQEAIARNKESLTCDRCGVTGGGPNMLRWHFENCKSKAKQCKECGKDIPMQGIKPYLYNQKKFCNRACYMESKKGIPPIKMTKEVRKKLSDARKSLRRKD